ncbi:MAG: hypothetical protein IPN69_18145 [Acidobacteria bacterium]|nr:hypothetical protein [Acidobacteriota bacterium]
MRSTGSKPPATISSSTSGREGHLIRETMNSIESKLDPEQVGFCGYIAFDDRQHRPHQELQPMFSGDYAVIHARAAN